MLLDYHSCSCIPRSLLFGDVASKLVKSTAGSLQHLVYVKLMSANIGEQCDWNARRHKLSVNMRQSVWPTASSS